MRTVARRITHVEQPRPPWTWRSQWLSGAPRTCLSNHREDVYIRRNGRVWRAGQLDWLLRLYQHSGITESSVRWLDYVLYDLEQELPLLTGAIDWIELIDNYRHVVFRVSSKEALAAGRVVDTPDGPRFGVPIGAYQAHERD